MKLQSRWLWVVPALAMGACSEGTPPNNTFDPDASLTDDIVVTDDVVVKSDVVNADATQITDVVVTDGGTIADDVSDAGTVKTDTGAVETDAGTVTDTGVVETDAGTVTDTGVVEVDAGTVTDTGVVEVDAGTVTDTGVIEVDAGTGTDVPVVTDVPAVTDVPVVTDTGADAGSTPPANDLPANATTLNLATPLVTVMGTTVNATRQGTCGGAAEVYYRFTLTQREVVWVNTFGSSYDTTVALASSTGTELSGSCNDDSSCGGLQSSSAQVLAAGTYLVAVGGFSTATGAFVLNFNHLPVGNGAAVQVTSTAAGVRTFTGTTSGTGTVTQSCGNLGSSSPEDTYWFTTCPSFTATTLTASTCGGATWDTVVEQRSTNRTAAVCNDDGTPGCGVRSRAGGSLTAGAGLHTVYVDGYNGGAGAYALALSFGDCATGTNLCSTACRNLQTDTANCGACGTACAMGQACTNGVCGCPSGQTVCSGACVDTTSSTANCGACGTTCTAANATPVCTNRVCGIGTCNAGFGNCDSNAANGCETNTNTTVANCGACGNVCTAANGVASCAAGACGVASCNAGFGNCDSNAANGCETNTTANNAHCGACGNVCGSGTTCVTSVCRPVNDLPANALALTLSSPSVTVTGNTTGATTQGNCGGGDVYYRFTLTQREVVWANTFGSAFDTEIAFLNAAGTQLVSACIDDVCGGNTSAEGVTLNAGTYLIAVSGFSTAAGAFTLNVHHLPVGNGPAVEVDDTSPGVRNFSGTTAGTGTLTQSCGNGAGPENTYWFGTCPGFTAAPFTASTCGGATWDTVVEQRSTNRTGPVCNDDTTSTCGARSLASGTLSAGAALHAVYVDGFGTTALGAYNVALSFGGCATGQTLCTDACRNLQTDNANCGACGTVCATGTTCMTGVCRAAGPANDLRANATTVTLNAGETRVTGTTVGASFDGPSGCGGTDVPNVWYRVVLSQSEILYADTAGSAYDTRLFLVDNNGALVGGSCSDDAQCSTGGFTSTAQSRFAVQVAAGTYFVAVSGYLSSSTGTFTLNLQHIPANYGSRNLGAITGTATTSTQTLQSGSLRTPTCTVGPSGEDLRWFVTCGSTTASVFSTCPADGATWTRQIGGTTYDAAMYIFSGSSGTEVQCNDDGGSNCQGTGGDTLNYGSRISATIPRGLNAVIVDERTRTNGMSYTLRHVIQ